MFFTRMRRQEYVTCSYSTEAILPTQDQTRGVTMPVLSQVEELSPGSEPRLVLMVYFFFGSIKNNSNNNSTKFKLF